MHTKAKGAKILHPLENGKKFPSKQRFFSQTALILVYVDTLWFRLLFEFCINVKTEMF